MADVGKIRRRISLVNLAPSQGGDGSWTATNGSVIITCWGYRRKLNAGREYNQYSQKFDNIYEYEIWYNSLITLTTNMIIRDESKDYTIQSVDLIDDKKRKYRLTATVKNG